MTRLFVAAAIVAVVNASSFARPIQLYTYEQLFKEADLVVIGTAIGNEVPETKDSHEKLGKDYVGRNVTFVIDQTLKGTAGSDKIEMLHFKYVGKTPIINAPMLVDICITPQTDPADTLGVAQAE